VPGGALRWIGDSDEPGALLTRRLLPVGLVGLPAVGGLVVAGEHHGLYAGASTAALLVVACVVVVAAVTWAAARTLTAVDRRRILAIDELTEFKLDLQRQVVDRATQLQRRRDEISVLEDRQRIAAELHDGVIQRLFAAGMFLQGSAAGTTDPDARVRLDAAVETMDSAIKDLRASIHELGRPGLVSDLSNAVDEVCGEAARTLGFLPDVIVDDPDNRGEDLRTDVLAVLREALANVARHAGATRAHVVLRSRGGFLWLTVADDGDGMGRAAGGRGTRDMVKRARDHGGDCTWVAVQPHGTRVQWYVPAVFPAPAVP
jgi:signal transduction histidine kinase